MAGSTLGATTLIPTKLAMNVFLNLSDKDLETYIQTYSTQIGLLVFGLFFVAMRIYAIFSPRTFVSDAIGSIASIPKTIFTRLFSPFRYLFSIISSNMVYQLIEIHALIKKHKYFKALLKVGSQSYKDYIVSLKEFENHIKRTEITSLEKELFTVFETLCSFDKTKCKKTDIKKMIAQFLHKLTFLKPLITHFFTLLKERHQISRVCSSMELQQSLKTVEQNITQLQNNTSHWILKLIYVMYELVKFIVTIPYKLYQLLPTKNKVKRNEVFGHIIKDKKQLDHFRQSLQQGDYIELINEFTNGDIKASVAQLQQTITAETLDTLLDNIFLYFYDRDKTYGEHESQLIFECCFIQQLIDTEGVVNALFMKLNSVISST